MITVEKLSSPGWRKRFATPGEALTELRLHVCDSCFAGGEYDLGNGEVHKEPAPNPDSLYDLLGTPCGCEFDVYENENERRWYVPTELRKD